MTSSRVLLALPMHAQGPRAGHRRRQKSTSPQALSDSAFPLRNPKACAGLRAPLATPLSHSASRASRGALGEQQTSTPRGRSSSDHARTRSQAGLHEPDEYYVLIARALLRAQARRSWDAARRLLNCQALQEPRKRRSRRLGAFTSARRGPPTFIFPNANLRLARLSIPRVASPLKLTGAAQVPVST